MDRPPHDYASSAAMAFAQQQQQQQQFGFHLQIQQFPPSAQGPPFLPPHPSMQQFPFPRQQQPQPLPPHPHLLHLQQQHPPPTFPPHLPPHLVASPFGGPYDSPPPPVPPPADPELHRRIDKLVEYVAKNGPEFEAMVREREQDKPEYSFLFGGEGHGYYRYKLWLCARPPGPFNAPFPSSMPVMHGPHGPIMTPPGPPLNPAAAGSSAPLIGASPLHQSPFPPYYDQQHHQYSAHGRPDYDHPTKPFRGLSGPLPSDVAMELNTMLGTLSGTKESIKGAKAWFMQRSPFAPALAEALRERIFSVDDSEKQLHIIYLANDILFDSLQRRVNPLDLDNEAVAFKPVLGSMLARIYHNPQNKEENQSRLQKILQFWASKEVYDQETIHALEAEMLAGMPPAPSPGAPKDLRGSSVDVSVAEGLRNLIPNSSVPQWQQEKQNNLLNQEQPDRQGAALAAMQPGKQFAVPSFPGSVPLSSPGLPTSQLPAAANVVEKPPPYPLFPPGLIPGMVRKQQIGSGVPYSPMSPLDIPTVIPPSDITESDILERVSKFFKEIGEVNPSEGPMNSSDASYEDDYERQSPVRKGGACIPPPPNLQALDPETGTYADGSVDGKAGSGGSGRLGLGATADPNEPSQYDDVYTSYRKQRSTTYHSSMGARGMTG